MVSEVEDERVTLWAVLKVLATTLLDEVASEELRKLLAEKTSEEVRKLLLLASIEYAVGAYTLGELEKVLVLAILDVLGTNIDVDVVKGAKLLELAGEDVSVYVIVYVSVGA